MLRTISRTGNVLRQATQKGELKNEDISTGRRTRDGAICCRVQHFPGGSCRRTTWTTRTSWTDRPNGRHRADGRPRPDGLYRGLGTGGSDRRRRPTGTDRRSWQDGRLRSNRPHGRPGRTRTSSAVPCRAAPLYGSRLRKNELRSGLRKACAIPLDSEVDSAMCWSTSSRGRVAQPPAFRFFRQENLTTAGARNYWNHPAFFERECASPPFDAVHSKTRQPDEK